MTKSQLIKKLEQFSEDLEVYVEIDDNFYDGTILNVHTDENKIYLVIE